MVQEGSGVKDLGLVVGGGCRAFLVAVKGLGFQGLKRSGDSGMQGLSAGWGPEPTWCRLRCCVLGRMHLITHHDTLKP